jgi:hypothetical protein
MTSENGNPRAANTGAPGTRVLSSNDPANTLNNRPLQDALKYATLGLAVFPCVPRSKHPAFPGGFKNGTTNPATIRRWWLARPDYNIGIATGAISGVWVLDVDGHDGVIALTALEAEHGKLPDTLVSATAEGCHLWFAYTCPISCSADARVGRGVHIRGDLGYVLGPGSTHPDGPRYRWLNERPPAVAPGWLVRLTRKPPPGPITSKIASPSRPGRMDVYGQAALDYEIAELANTLPGSRNAALNRASFSLHQLVAGGELDASEVRYRLIQAATANGLMSDPNDGPRSVARTIASGARAGLQHPRSRA